MTAVDFPCAIAECCDVQLDYSIRNNEVQSCDITSALCACASSTCTRAIQRKRVDLLRHTFLVTMCYVTANEIPRAHGKSTTVTRRSSLDPRPPSEGGKAWY